MKPIEYRRYFPITDLRAAVDGDARTISGYAAVFDSFSEPLYGMFREVIRRGAFTKTLKEGAPILAWSHDMSKPLASVRGGNLVIQEDDRGLWFRATLNGTSWAEDAFKSIEARDVSQMSFGFSVVKDRWSQSETDSLDERELLEVALFEISPVAFPAYSATEVQARSIFENAKNAGGVITSQIREADGDKPADTTVEPDADSAPLAAGRHRIALAKRKIELIDLWSQSHVENHPVAGAPRQSV